MTKDEIRLDLLQQLKDKGVNNPVFIDLVNDYISFWVIKNKLIEDIMTRGVSCTYKNGANQYGQKKNDSIAELNRVNGQMLTILRDLGLKAEKEQEDEEFVL